MGHALLKNHDDEDDDESGRAAERENLTPRDDYARSGEPGNRRCRQGRENQEGNRAPEEDG